MMNKLMSSYADQMEQIHHGSGWIGVSFDKKLNEISDLEFFYQIQNTHSVAEIISHLTTWRIESILKIKSGKGSIKDDDPSNWIKNKDLIKLGRKKILHKHDQSLLQLISLLRQKNDAFLKETYFDNDFNSHFPYSFLVNGMLQHDLYHLGQIGLILKAIKI